MKISPRYTVAHWKKLKLTPQSREPVWQEAVKIFDDRIQGRFFRFIDKIKQYNFSGFVVLGLDCMLAETLQAFREGKLETKSETRKVFLRFLRGASDFKIFCKGSRAEKFYEHVRSRIVHHGDTTGGWLVRRGSRLPFLKPRSKNACIVNRDKFHLAVLHEFEYYKRLLVTSRGRRTDQKCIDEIRQNFINKMNSICASETPV